MKVLIYNHEDMLRAGEILRNITVTGISNIRMLAELADILDSGQTGNCEEEKDGIGDGVECKEIQQDKLEK